MSKSQLAGVGMTPCQTELGILIRSRREELGLTLHDLAVKMEFTPLQARDLEIRRDQGISYGRAKLLSRVLELDPSAFVRFVVKVQKPAGNQFGELVRARRRQLFMSLTQLGEKVGVTAQTLNHIELGRSSLSRSHDLIIRLAQALELEVDQLLAVRPHRKLKELHTRGPLGNFLSTRRLQLHLTQDEVGKRARISGDVVGDVETGRYLPKLNLLDRLGAALNCRIPPELIPVPRRRGRPPLP